MSKQHPIISFTGSSGAGTTTVKTAIDQIFRREKVKAVYADGDAFHRYDRKAMKRELTEREAKGDRHFSHFGPDANLLADLEGLFKAYGQSGSGRVRRYIHDQAEAEIYGAAPGEFTEWRDLEPGSDVLCYEGLHGAFVGGGIDVAKYADLKIGVVPVINLEWIQKIHRDKTARGHSAEAISDTILRRMPDYVNYICPQFSRTDINFQRVPTVDTSNPFVSRWIPTPDESMVVIRFAVPYGIDFPYLLAMIHGSFMSRANSIVVPGNKLDLAVQLLMTPMVHRLMDTKKRAG
jgi:phosphoribulokinase